MADIEIWKPIKHLYGTYEVSDKGRVRSINRVEVMKNGVKRPRKGRILAQKIESTGYRSVHVSIKGKPKNFLTHRLVAEAFIPNPHRYPCINHKDNNRANNCIENLEWCSYQYNNTYDGCRDRAVMSRGYRKVKKFSLDGTFIEEYRSCHAASIANGLSNGNLYSTLHGKQKTCGGYIWRYADDPKS